MLSKACLIAANSYVTVVPGVTLGHCYLLHVENAEALRTALAHMGFMFGVFFAFEICIQASEYNFLHPRLLFNAHPVSSALQMIAVDLIDFS